MSRLLLLHWSQAKTTMKITFVALFVLLAGTAFGQAVSAISSQVQMYQIPDHPLHADEHAMAPEHSLLSSSNPYTYAQGERPLWEFGPASPSPSLTPLGDIARAFRKEKLALRKAEIVLEKQGS